MKKTILTVAILMTIGIYALSFMPIIGQSEKNETSEEKKYVTEVFVVQSETPDGHLEAKPLVASSLEGSYILESKYNLGDIVEVTYWNDDILKERVITGEELEGLEEKYDTEINAIYEEGMGMDL